MPSSEIIIIEDAYASTEIIINLLESLIQALKSILLLMKTRMQALK